MKNLIVFGLVVTFTTGCSKTVVEVGTDVEVDKRDHSSVDKVAEIHKGDDSSVYKVHQKKCEICTEEKAYYSRAVAQPSPCNDYPVEHRVQIPEVDDRSRSVHRLIVTSDVNALLSTVDIACSRR